MNLPRSSIFLQCPLQIVYDAYLASGSFAPGPHHALPLDPTGDFRPPDSLCQPYLKTLATLMSVKVLSHRIRCVAPRHRMCCHTCCSNTSWQRAARRRMAPQRNAPDPRCESTFRPYVYERFMTEYL